MVQLTDYVEFQGVKVYYTKELDGGGAGFGQDYIDFIRGNFPPQKRIFEWCAGPGFIGFSLLAHGLCKTLCLADINPLAINAQKQYDSTTSKGGSLCICPIISKTSLLLKNGVWS